MDKACRTENDRLADLTYQLSRRFSDIRLLYYGKSIGLLRCQTVAATAFSLLPNQPYGEWRRIALNLRALTAQGYCHPLDPDVVPEVVDGGRSNWPLHTFSVTNNQSALPPLLPLDPLFLAPRQVPVYFEYQWPPQPAEPYELLNYPVRDMAGHLESAFWTPTTWSALLYIVGMVYFCGLAIVWHCFPFRKWARWLNPFYCCRRIVISRLRRSSRHRLSSPRRRRQLQEVLALLPSRHGLPIRPPRRCKANGTQRSRSAPLRAPLIRDPDGSGRLVPVCLHNDVVQKPPFAMATFDLIIQGRTVRALYDTGSSISLVLQELVTELGLTIFEKATLKAKSVSGHLFPLLGRVTASLTIGPKTITSELHVAKDLPHSIIIGLDLMEQLGPVTFDWSERRLTFEPDQGGSAIAGISLGVDGSSTWSVPLIETTILPPRVETFLSVPAPKGVAGKDVSVYFEPNVNVEVKRQAFFARMVSNVKSGFLSLRVLNPTAAPIVLYKSTTLGHLSITAGTPEKQPPSIVAPVTVTPEVPFQSPSSMVAGSTPPASEGSPLDKVVIDRTVLTKSMESALLRTLNRHKDVFAHHPYDLGQFKGFQAEIHTEPNVAPVRHKPYSIPIAKREFLDSEITSMIKAGVVRPSCSPWAAPVVLVSKKDGGMRTAIDYRSLNSVTRKDCFPLPMINEIIDSVGNSRWFTALDLQSGFWQLPLREEDCMKTAFVTHRGLFEFTRLPFGVVNGPPQYQRALQLILTGLAPEIAQVYIDDILVHSSTFDQHLIDLDRIFTRPRSGAVHGEPAQELVLHQPVPLQDEVSRQRQRASQSDHVS